jgi:hypothetical protein
MLTGPEWVADGPGTDLACQPSRACGRIVECQGTDAPGNLLSSPDSELAIPTLTRPRCLAQNAVNLFNSL